MRFFAEGARCLVRLVLVLATLQAAAWSQDRPLLIRAARVIPVEGAPLGGGSVLVHKGRITAVGEDVKAPAGARVIAFDEGLVFPGLVDAGSWLGVYRDRAETTRAILPGVRMSESFNPFDNALAATLRAGITTFHVVPGDQDLVGGQTAVAGLDADGRARFLERSAGLKLSLDVSAWTGQREPTSLAGGIALLRRSAASLPLIQDLARGKRKAFASAGRRVEIEAACRLPDTCGFRAVLMTTPEVRHHLALVASATRGVVLRPLLPALEPVERRVAADLEKAGIPLAFMSTAPALPPSSLRLSAVVATAAGLSREGAWKALTLDAARLLGVDDRVGSLKPGKQADLVVFDRDPTDPRARILLVLQDGKLAWRAEEKK